MTYRDKYVNWDQDLHETLKKLLRNKRVPGSDKYTLELDREQVEKIIRYLRALPFFKRLNISGQKFKEIVENMTYVDKKLLDIVFDEEEDLYIVLNGRVVLRLHDQDPLNYSMAAQYTSGMVIGHDTLDKGLSRLGQAFPVVTSEQCDLVRVNKVFFQ